MEFNIKTKFNIDDEVYYISNNTIYKSKIDKIYANLETFPSCKTVIKYRTKKGYFETENNFYERKEYLLKAIDKTETEREKEIARKIDYNSKYKPW